MPDRLDTEGDGQVKNTYILTNSAEFYGAAGILDRKLVQEFADGRDFFILPSSVNETIFVPAEEGSDMEIYNCMVNRFRFICIRYARSFVFLIYNSHDDILLNEAEIVMSVSG